MSSKVGDFFWLDGALVARNDASVSVLDHALAVGDGAFETIPVVDGRAFALSRHLARLRLTLDGLGVRCEATDLQLSAAIAAVIQANGERGQRIRLTVTGGLASMGLERDSMSGTVLIGSTSTIPRDDVTAVVIAPWTRNEHGVLAGLKTISYAENVVAFAYASARASSEALFANTRGELCEGTGSNIFVVVDDELVTPPLSSGCLAGITRALLLELMPIVERPLGMAELETATEAFLTSSTRDVQAIGRIDTRTLPDRRPASEEAARLFTELKKTVIDP
jgi:branched-chain amino acid aminotransferase